MSMAPPEPDVSTSQELVFLTNWSCPYSQRVAIALNEKEVPHQVVEIDLNEKPDWFFKYSTYGFTPAFMVPYGNSARGVFHNLFCNEYLEDAYPTNALLPADLVKRAEARRLIDAIANKSIASLYRAQLADADDQQELFAAVDDELRWLDKSIQGPYFLGEAFSLVDCALLPWLLRMPAYCAVTGYKQPEGLISLEQYVSRCLERPSVAASCCCRPGTAEPSYASYQEQLLHVYQQPELAAYFMPSLWRPRKK